ncbi:hypothetical protein D3C78_1044950 [compost metagenome]
MVKVHAISPDDTHRRQKLGGREPGAVDDRIDFMPLAVNGFNAAFSDSRNAVGHQLHVGPAHGLEVFARQQDTLAAVWIIRGQFVAQYRVRHLLGQQSTERNSHCPLHQALESGERQRPGLVAHVYRGTVRGHHPGHVAQQ